MRPEEDPYFGDDATRRFQEARDAQVKDMAETPGAVVHTRVPSADDPEQYGWDRLHADLAREGAVSLRGVSEAVIETGKRTFASLSPTLHMWDIFMGQARDLRAACTPIVANGLPAGITRQPDDTIDWASLHEMQGFLVEHGISPFSKAALSGALFPAKPVILRKPDGGIAAAAFASITHNRFSWLHDIAWVGLVAVDPDMRGMGMGKAVDAIANLVAIDELGAKGTTEFVALDNQPSRGMLMACGLQHVPNRQVAMFSVAKERMTR